MGKTTYTVLSTLCVFIISLVVVNDGICRKRPILKEGDYFPEVTLSAPYDPAHASYLGIDKGKPFSMEDVKADLILTEVMNINCHSCQSQAPINNQLFDLIESNPKTKGRIKMLAVAVGSMDVYIKEFTAHFKTPYPVIQDPGFKVYDAVGEGPVPRMVLVRRDPEWKRSVVAVIHMGFDPEYQALFKEIQTLMDTPVATLREREPKLVGRMHHIKPFLTEEALEKKIRTAFSEEGDGLTRYEKVAIENGLDVHMGRVKKGAQLMGVFAVVVNRPPPCDVCHDIQFIYVFDETGKIRQFIPLQLTKYGNEDFDEADLEKTRKRIVGRTINMPFDFDPEVDAVTSATITSSMIFKSLNEGLAVFNALKEKGLL